MSHSKRNTSLAFFTSHERAELKGTWGSRQARLNRESFLPFGSCQLCLLPSRDAVACPDAGHLFCRECALSNVLAQREEMKRAKKDAERRKVAAAEDDQLQSAEKAAKELEEFERLQAGSGGDARHSTGPKRKNEEEDRPSVELAQLAKEGGMYSGKRQKREEKSFWIPEAIPDNKEREAKAIRTTPLCPASHDDKPHELSLKTLVNVQFSGEEKKESPWRMCPACDKPLSNTTKAVLAKPCGHVCCKPCSDKFQKPAEQTAHDAETDETVSCYVCQEDITPGRRRKRDGKEKEKHKVQRGLTLLDCDGTGFAGGGRAEVKKHGVAFQC